MSGAEAASARYRALVAQASQAHGARDYAAAAAFREQVCLLGDVRCLLAAYAARPAWPGRRPCSLWVLQQGFQGFVHAGEATLLPGKGRCTGTSLAPGKSVVAIC